VVVSELQVCEDLLLFLTAICEKWRLLTADL